MATWIVALSPDGHPWHARRTDTAGKEEPSEALRQHIAERAGKPWSDDTSKWPRTGSLPTMHVSWPDGE